MEEQPSACTHRCGRDRGKNPKGPMTRLNKATLLKKSVYEIGNGSPSWIKKQINANTLTVCLVGWWSPTRMEPTPFYDVWMRVGEVGANLKTEYSCNMRVASIRRNLADGANPIFSVPHPSVSVCFPCPALELHRLHCRRRVVPLLVLSPPASSASSAAVPGAAPPSTSLHRRPLLLLLLLGRVGRRERSSSSRAWRRQSFSSRAWRAWCRSSGGGRRRRTAAAMRASPPPPRTGSSCST